MENLYFCIGPGFFGQLAWYYIKPLHELVGFAQRQYFDVLNGFRLRQFSKDVAQTGLSPQTVSQTQITTGFHIVFCSVGENLT